MSRSTRRARHARRDNGGLSEGGFGLGHRAIPLAAALSTTLAALFLMCCLLVLLAWPRARDIKEKGLLAAAREQVKVSAQQLKELTLPEFVAKVAARLRDDGVPVTVEDGGTRLVFSDAGAHFDRGSAQFRADAKQKFEAFSRALAWGMTCYVKPVSTSCGAQTVVACEKGYAPFAFGGVALVGHADAVPFRPNAEGRTNETLAKDRGLAAQTLVTTCLDEAGIDLLPEGLGASVPLVTPGVDERNRRVEVRFLP